MPFDLGFKDKGSMTGRMTGRRLNPASISAHIAGVLLLPGEKEVMNMIVDTVCSVLDSPRGNPSNLILIIFHRIFGYAGRMIKHSDRPTADRPTNLHEEKR